MITLDGYALEYFGLIAQPGHENGLSPTVDRVVPVPLVDGAYDFGSDNGPKPFNFPLAWASELNRVELQRKIRTFTAFLYDSRGKARDIQLIFEYEGERYYTVRYAGTVMPERLFSMAFFTLPLVAFDPYAYTVEDPLLDSDIILDSDILLDGGFFTFEISSNQTVVVPNNGSLITRPYITIVGSFSTLSLTSGGINMTYDEAISGQTLIIDGPRRIVKIGSTNKMSETNKLFIEVEPGDNDVIISGTSMDFDITFSKVEKYL